MNLPPLKTKGRMKFPPDGHSRDVTILDQVRRRQSDYEDKFFCLQHFRFDDDGKEEFRLGYYIVGKTGRMKGKWVWGQYCPLIPKKDFEALIIEAQKKGWLASP